MYPDWHILKRWMICAVLLTIQLASFAMPVAAAHRQLAGGAWRFYDEGHRAPEHVEADEQPAHEVGKTQKHRRKHRLYIPAPSRQYTYENYAVFQLSQDYSLSIFIPENKTGEYRFQHAFLPAYYHFLFRLTPF